MRHVPNRVKWGNGWIGVDLDGTLAHYDKWRGIDHIGEPVPRMLSRVADWLLEGKDVRIFTARGDRHDPRYPQAVAYIEAWCLIHLGRILPVTNEKDLHMIELWDDRATQVVPNTGAPVTEETEALRAYVRELEQDLVAARMLIQERG